MHLIQIKASYELILFLFSFFYLYYYQFIFDYLISLNLIYIRIIKNKLNIFLYKKLHVNTGIES
jgi:hypothetical protein